MAGNVQVEASADDVIETLEMLADAHKLPVRLLHCNAHVRRKLLSLTVVLVRLWVRMSRNASMEQR